MPNVPEGARWLLVGGMLICALSEASTLCAMRFEDTPFGGEKARTKALYLVGELLIAYIALP